MSSYYHFESRLHRALSQRIYLVSRGEGNEEGQTFRVMGASSFIYTVKPHELKCSCPDNRTRGAFCKHLIFLAIRVFHLAELAAYTIFQSREWLGEYEAPAEIKVAPSSHHRKEPEDDEECSICCEKFAETVDEEYTGCTQCSNIFHETCIYNWLQVSPNANCPLCRSGWSN